MQRLVWVFCFCFLSLSLAWSDDQPPSRKQAGFDALKKLVGTWTAPGDGGKTITTQFRLTAGGSVLVETLFPGQPEEMVSVYHMDGPDLILTHYCMLGNQPRLKAESAQETKKLSFKSVGGTNMKLNDMHMGQATITLVDDDHFEAEWCACSEGKPDASHRVHMKWTRKK